MEGADGVTDTGLDREDFDAVMAKHKRRQGAFKREVSWGQHVVIVTDENGEAQYMFRDTDGTLVLAEDM